MKEVPCWYPIPITNRELLSEATSNKLSMKLAFSSGGDEIEKQARPILIRSYSNLFKQ